MARSHIVLVGLPGAGKTTVGAIVAARLGAPFQDLDRVIESRTGRSVAQLFAEQGEAAFRALEAGVGAELLAGPPSILAPGGGFFGDQDQRRRTLSQAYAIYLKTSAAVAARRLAGTPDRPLLAGFQPMLRLRLLLEQREAGYLEAQGHVTTDGRAPETVAAEVLELARTYGGW